MTKATKAVSDDIHSLTDDMLDTSTTHPSSSSSSNCHTFNTELLSFSTSSQSPVLGYMQNTSQRQKTQVTDVSLLITSAEEGGYVFSSVCLSVCLLWTLPVCLTGRTHYGGRLHRLSGFWNLKALIGGWQGSREGRNMIYNCMTLPCYTYAYQQIDIT